MASVERKSIENNYFIQVMNVAHNYQQIYIPHFSNIQIYFTCNLLKTEPGRPNLFSMLIRAEFMQI